MKKCLSFVRFMFTNFTSLYSSWWSWLSASIVTANVTCCCCSNKTTFIVVGNDLFVFFLLLFKVAIHTSYVVCIQIKVKLKLVKANGYIDTKHKCLNCARKGKKAWHAVLRWATKKISRHFGAHAHLHKHTPIFIMWISVRFFLCRNSHSIWLHLCLRSIMLCAC